MPPKYTVLWHKTYIYIYIYIKRETPLWEGCGVSNTGGNCSYCLVTG